MPENQPTDVSELEVEVRRLRQALWETLVAVDDLAYMVEFAREQEAGSTRSVVDAINRARDILKGEESSRPPLKPRKAAR